MNYDICTRTSAGIGLIVLLAMLPAFWIGPSTALADDLLELREYDDDGGEHQIPLKSGIVDVNSTIDVMLHKQAIRTGIARMLDLEQFPPEQLTMMAHLQSWAAKGSDALPGVAQAIKIWQENPQDVEGFESAMNSAAKALGSILDYLSEHEGPLGDRIMRRIKRNPDSSMYYHYRLVFEEAANYAAALSDSLDSALRDQAVYIVLGAWLRTQERNTPLHLAGFDTYPEGEYYRVPRWSVAPTQEQREEIEKLRLRAAELNERQEDVGRAIVATSLADGLAVIRTLVEQCADSIRGDIQEFLDEAAALSGEVESDLDQLKTDLAQLVEAIEAIEGRIRAGGAGEDLNRVFDRVMTDYSMLEGLIRAIIGDIDRLRAHGDVAVREGAQRLRATLEKCKKTLEDQVSKGVDRLKNAFAMHHAGQEINQLALEFGEEVVRHDLASLPAQTSLDLHFTGNRRAGDVIHFRLAAARVDPEAELGSGQPALLDEAKIKTYHIQMHLETSVCLIFADPHDSTALVGRFNYAPSYSVLLKWGYRNSSFYNRLVGAGVGLNIAALDFDRNDEPEFGVALVASLFKDCLQGGYGYNPAQDNRYWFFGVRLPLPSLGLTGGSTGQE